MKGLSEKGETLTSLVKQKAFEAARKYIDFLESQGVEPVAPEGEEKVPEGE